MFSTFYALGAAGLLPLIGPFGEHCLSPSTRLALGLLAIIFQYGWREGVLVNPVR